MAGGRYDYLASIYTQNNKALRKQLDDGGALPAIGWAAGIDRLVMVYEELEERFKRLETETGYEGKPVLGLLSMIDKAEVDEGIGRTIRRSCYKLKGALEMQDELNGVKLDLREKQKLNDRMRQLFDSDHVRGTLIIGQQECHKIMETSEDQLKDLVLPLKVRGKKEVLTCKLSEIVKHL